LCFLDIALDRGFVGRHRNGKYVNWNIGILIGQFINAGMRRKNEAAAVHVLAVFLLRTFFFYMSEKYFG
jgi:hypothetical protein